MYFHPTIVLTTPAQIIKILKIKSSFIDLLSSLLETNTTIYKFTMK